MKRCWLRLAAAIIVAACLLPAAPALATDDRKLEPVNIVTAGGTRVLQVEIADTPATMSKGLKYRTSLGDDRGMLFHFQPAREVTMWMQDTPLSLDMVFIRSDGRVHRIETYTEPFSQALIRSNGVVSSVLEIRAGRAEALGIKPGDLVVHRFFTGDGG